MELIVFDLDGTLLNAAGEISDYTRETLDRLSARGIAYTVATGRTLHGAKTLLQGSGFHLPQIFKNGVVIWDPAAEDYSRRNVLTLGEVEHVLQAIFDQGITPFIFTLEPGNRHAIYHPPLQTEVERRLVGNFEQLPGLSLQPVAEMPADADITNISALGEPAAIDRVTALIDDEPHLVAYAGTALEGEQFKWLDIHHMSGSKGGAVDILRRQLGAERVICFGDSDNDLSMFARADECYAPANAKQSARDAADAIIGHHDEDGVARFLRERFDL